ncbi:MAG: hypothetical protein QW409_02775 [Candidatus Aenigmatarchaeota archaeon]
MDFVTFSVIFFSIILAIDILYSRKERIITFKNAIIWSFIWIFTSIVFIILAAESFKINDLYTLMAIYLTEKIFSINNLSIFLLIFSIAKINIRQKLKILSFGLYLSMLFRIALIFLGVILVNTFLNLSYLIISVVLVLFGYSMINEKTTFINKCLSIISKFKKSLPQNDNQRLPIIYLSTSHIAILSILLGIVNFIFSLDNTFSILVITSDLLSLITVTLLAVIGLKPLYFLLEDATNRIEKLRIFLGIYMFYLAFESLLKVFKIEIPSNITIFILLTLISTPIILHFSEKFTPSHYRKKKIK